MLRIEIFSDVICPWCFIGKRRLDEALKGELGEGVELRWRPYQLYPALPAQGMDRLTFLQRRYGDAADGNRAPTRITQEAEGEGIHMRYDLMQRIPNTLLAHRLLEFAHPSGVQHQLAETLFDAYFCRGQDVGDIDTLIQEAATVGLEPAETERYLRSDEGHAEVQSQLQRAPELGVSGVPGYYLADSFLLPGAQTSDVMQQILQRVKTRLAERA